MRKFHHFTQSMVIGIGEDRSYGYLWLPRSRLLSMQYHPLDIPQRSIEAAGDSPQVIMRGRVRAVYGKVDVVPSYFHQGTNGLLLEQGPVRNEKAFHPAPLRLFHHTNRYAPTQERLPSTVKEEVPHAHICRVLDESQELGIRQFLRPVEDAVFAVQPFVTRFA